MLAIQTQNDQQPDARESAADDANEQGTGTQGANALSRSWARANLWIQRPVVVVMLSVAAWIVALDVVAVAGARLIDPRPELGLGALPRRGCSGTPAGMSG